MNKNVTRRQLTVAGLGGAALLGLGRFAHATACPPDQVRLDGSGQKPGATMPKGVTDNVIASMALVEETEVGVNDRLFRLRRLEIKPGGLSSDVKCNTPRRSDIGKVVQDLKE